MRLRHLNGMLFSGFCLWTYGSLPSYGAGIGAGAPGYAAATCKAAATSLDASSAAGRVDARAEAAGLDAGTEAASAEAGSLDDSAAAARELTAMARQLNATHDVGATVAEVLEPAQLAGACSRHFSRLNLVTGKLPAAARRDPEQVRDMVRCGKWLYFAADFASKMAIPEGILRSMPELFPAETGPAFSRQGMIENPFEPGLPVGFVRLEASPWGPLAPATGPARGIACATCHFGQMPDGRYAAGMPNQNLDFGRVNALLVYSAWRADYRKQDASIWPLELQAFYQGLDAKLESATSPSRALFDVAAMVSWLRASDSFYTFTGASRPIYAEAATWLSSTPNQYYASSPLLPVTGKSYWMAAPATWDMQSYPGDYAPGHARPLSSFTPSKSAEDFVALALIFQTGNDTYAQAKYVDPLVLYFRSLKTPANLAPPPAALALAGKTLFSSHCSSCHNGSDGETLQAYPAAQLGTPSVLIDPLLDYVAPKALSAEIYSKTVRRLGYRPLTNDGVFSRKLKGIYARRHLMLNGSVLDLASAFCLEQDRGHVEQPAGLRDDIHLDLCRDYGDDEKRSLIAFLTAWD